MLAEQNYLSLQKYAMKVTLSNTTNLLHDFIHNRIKTAILLYKNIYCLLSNSDKNLKLFLVFTYVTVFLVYDTALRYTMNVFCLLSYKFHRRISSQMPTNTRKILGLY